MKQPEKAAREQIEAALVLSEAEFARQDKTFRTGVGSRRIWIAPVPHRDQDQATTDSNRLEFRAEKTDGAANLVWFTTRFFARANGSPAGKPVVVLLPPQNIKVRAFVPETRIGNPFMRRSRARGRGRRERSFPRQSELYFAAGGIHAAGHLQPREPGQTRLHGRRRSSTRRLPRKLHPGQPVDVEFRSEMNDGRISPSTCAE